VPLLVAFGCARPDWIEQTLVTMDVTGVWIGMGGDGQPCQRCPARDGATGTKVNGNLVALLKSNIGFEYRGGPIDGAVSGDMFRFKTVHEDMAGEMRVDGDEMQGYSTVGGKSPFFLRRVSSSPRPRSQQP
jgi:hypothetical protein